MTTTFFNSWLLWEKLCFVLACAIVLTILAGCAKLIHKHYELRRHTRLATKQREEQKMQHVMVQERDEARDIPFGVRAIESGIEVDGVWISRSNTPASSNPPSPGSSVYEDPKPAKVHPIHHENGSLRNIPQLSMPQPVHPYPGHPGDRSRSVSRSPEVPAGGAASSEKLPRSPNGSEDAIKIRVQQTYKPRQSSHLRFSSGDVLGVGMVHDPEQKDSLAQDKQRTYRLSRCSLDSGSTQSYYVPQRPDHVSTFFSPSYIVQPSQVDNLPFTETTERIATNEDTVTGYDRTFATSLGHLSANNRASVASTGWSSVYSIPNEQGFAINQEPMPISSVLREKLSAFANPTIVASDPEEPPSFQSFVDAHPVNIQHQMAPLLHDDDHVGQGSKVQPLQNANANRQMKPPDVMRKVNSGFEILRPGTLGTRQQGANISDTRYGSDGSSTSRRSAKKLHKKTRSQSTSGMSSQILDA